MKEDHEIRLSQLILTYGPGALVDLPKSSVIVMGLDHWRFNERGTMREIHEPRLAGYLTELLKNPEGGKAPWIEDGVNLSLFEPPLNESDGFEKAKKVPVRHYPEWEVVSDPNNPKEQILQRRTSGKDKKVKKGIVKTPVRWIAACTNGHMQDINWRSFAHKRSQDCKQDLYLTDSGTGGDPQYIRVSCRCGASRQLSEMYIGNTLGKCNGNRPWLGGKYREPDCPETLAPMTRGAINNYYSQTLKLIALPVEKSNVVQLINNWLPRFDPISSKEMIPVLWGDAAMHIAFDGFSLDEIWSALQEIREGSEQSVNSNVENPKLAEFDLFACGAPTIGADALGARFHGETMNENDWRIENVFGTGFIRNLIKIHRMCEVSSLYGFTRIAPSPSPFEDGLEDIKLEVKGQSLASTIKWLPAMEQYGEGLFLHLDDDEIRKHLSKDKASTALARLEARYRDWYNKDTANRQDYPGHEYVFAHSLSHMLIEQIALDAGYPSTSLTERIYALKGRGSGKVSRLGILIYAAGGGSLGTLGGLLEQAVRLPQILANGVRRQHICSNDPICFTHSEVLTAEADMINGAACHGCLFTAETSCERRNVLLDRTSLLDVLTSFQ